MPTAFDIFSDIFAFSDNALTRIHPRVKVVVTLFGIVLIISSTRIILPLTIFALSIVGTRAIRVPMKLVMARLAAPAAIMLVLVVLQSFWIGSTPIFVLSLFKWKLVAYREGAFRGVLIACRVLGSVSLLLLMSSTTQAHQIFHTLRWFGVPKGWVEVAMLMYRYTFALLDQAGDIMNAQSLRLGYSNMKRSLSSAGVLAGTVITLSMDQAVRTYDAMTLRGYSGSMPFGPLPSLSAGDRLIIVLMPVVLLAAYLVCEWCPL